MYHIFLFYPWLNFCDELFQFLIAKVLIAFFYPKWVNESLTHRVLRSESLHAEVDSWLGYWLFYFTQKINQLISGCVHAILDLQLPTCSFIVQWIWIFVSDLLTFFFFKVSIQPHDIRRQTGFFLHSLSMENRVTKNDHMNS